MKIKLVKTKNPHNIPKILREKSKPVGKVTPEILTLAEKMTEIMNGTDGAGISAVQVGQLLRIMIVKIPQTIADGIPTQRSGQAQTIADKISLSRRNSQRQFVSEDVAFINPEIIKLSGKKVPFNEGCLSFPGVFLEIMRPEICKIRFQDLAGNLCEMEANGIVGRAFQHEIDHMDGILFFDHIGGAEGLKKGK